MLHDPFWRAVILGVAMAVALIFLLGQVMAQELPEHMHRADDPDHWYDAYCCNRQDCAPVAQPVRETANGYYVPDFDELVPYNDKRVKDSKDGRFHACKRYAKVDDTWIRCLYVPPRAF